MTPIQRHLMSNHKGISKNGLMAVYPFIQGADATKLYDISGNGYHGTLAAGDASPSWITGGGLAFDASKSQFVTLPSVFIPQAFTVQIVAKYTSGTYMILVGLDASLNMSLDGQYSSLGPRIAIASNNNRVWNRDVNTSDGSPHSFTFTVPGAEQSSMVSAQVMVDSKFNTINATNITGAQAARTSLLLGKASATSFLTGEMHYAIFYSRVLSVSEATRNLKFVKGTLAERGVVIP